MTGSHDKTANPRASSNWISNCNTNMVILISFMGLYTDLQNYSYLTLELPGGRFHSLWNF